MPTTPSSRPRRSSVSAGASARVTVSGQLDYVRYSEIRSTLLIRCGAFQREDYALDDALEPRLGVEARPQVRSRTEVWTWSRRWHSQAPVADW